MKRFLKSPYSWLAPPSLIVLFVITIVPTLFLFFTSLHHWELGYPWDARRFIGVQTFCTSLRIHFFLAALKRTLIYTFVSVGLQFFFGFLIALFLSRKTLIWKGILVGILIIPMTVTPSIAGLIWRLYFNPIYGIVNYFLGFIGLEPNWYSYSLALFFLRLSWRCGSGLLLWRSYCSRAECIASNSLRGRNGRRCLAAADDPSYNLAAVEANNNDCFAAAGNGRPENV